MADIQGWGLNASQVLCAFFSINLPFGVLFFVTLFCHSEYYLCNHLTNLFHAGLVCPLLIILLSLV